MPCIDYVIYGLLIVDGSGYSGSTCFIIHANESFLFSQQTANRHKITVNPPNKLFTQYDPGYFTVILSLHSPCNFALAKLYSVSIKSDQWRDLAIWPRTPKILISLFFHIQIFWYRRLSAPRMDKKLYLGEYLPGYKSLKNCIMLYWSESIPVVLAILDVSWEICCINTMQLDIHPKTKAIGCKSHLIMI